MVAALTFVHGINNGPSYRLGLKDRITAYLSKYNVLDLFEKPEQPTEHNVNVAMWDSLGDFGLDLMKISGDGSFREASILKVQTFIEQTQNSLKEQKDDSKIHIIVMHSFGQPFGMAAVSRINSSSGFSVPTAVISMGGPLGNKDPIFKGYFDWCRLPWWKYKALNLSCWVDLVNKDDPICYAKFSIFGSYSKPTGVTSTEYLDYPGKPSLEHPMEEHGSYFESKLTYDILKRVVLTGK